MGIRHMGHDFIERQGRGIDDPRAGRCSPENLAWHEEAGVEAYRTALDQPQSANGDQIGRTGAGADQMDGHRRATSR